MPIVRGVVFADGAELDLEDLAEEGLGAVELVVLEEDRGEVVHRGERGRVLIAEAFAAAGHDFREERD